MENIISEIVAIINNNQSLLCVNNTWMLYFITGGTIKTNFP